MHTNEEQKNNVNDSMEKADFNPDLWGINPEPEEESIEKTESEVIEEQEITNEEDDTSKDKEGEPPSIDTKDDSSLIFALGKDLYEKGVTPSFNEDEVKKETNEVVGEVKEDVEDSKVICDGCGREFKNAFALSGHKRFCTK